ncbi:MAG: hypothetical protein KKD78_11730, partial [Proteobacteria bacterium]|nr:hypothetical protein [Pseudomonadota bacterium]
VGEIPYCPPLLWLVCQNYYYHKGEGIFYSHIVKVSLFLRYQNIDDKTELMYGRFAMAGAILVAGYLGLNPPGFAAQVVALAFGLAASSIFPALMMGIFVKRMNNVGAICGMLAGLGSTLGYIFWFKGFMFIATTAMAPDNAANWWMGISPGSFGAVGALINFVVAFAASSVTKAPPEHIQHLVEDIRVPMGAGAAQSH